MGNVLYRKYRSQFFDELVGQSHITDTLKNAIKNRQFAHAYLFTGPRGVGKTSTARILAREINKLSPEEAIGHIDIIEIDAASNRRIDEIRDLREQVHTAPSQAKFKVYIIDEVHMLTKEAFNALLKTLEEPPEHVVFILATTEVHKLPETIVSRTQRFTFKPVSAEGMEQHLLGIAKKESILITKTAIQAIAKHADGSFRDAISILDQIQHSVADKKSEINENDVELALGTASDAIIEQFAAELKSKNIQGLLHSMQKCAVSGYDPKYIASNLYTHIISDIESSNSYAEETLDLLKSLLQVPSSYSPQNSLEIALLQFCTATTDRLQPEAPQENLSSNQPAAKITSRKEPEEPVALKTEDPVSPPRPDIELQAEQPKEQISEPKDTPKATVGNGDIESIWSQVIEKLKGRHNTLYGLARKVPATLNGDEVLLHCAFPFHVKRLSDTTHNKILSSTVSDIVGRPLKVSCILDKSAQKKPNSARPPIPETSADHSIEAISDIFGNAEVLES